ncbi:hypothetical protein F3Y22_tig00005401pilonHSYRG00019 [Hibiscus syriacus]|uniref:Reverse transcriptase zinc-binding domain-containing protein n=1 Tax=Hibiscus syriacus TaxID=106335 RepID=A0A6A3CKF1_HIBSY|nr:hypothetical protein F3Y22_tig00005401pilonHSYRG00019 [Hibiscus syriacus]
MIEKFKRRLDGWKCKVLSFGGKIYLVKSVLANLPVFYLSLFQMPSKVAKKLNQLIARFIWGIKDISGIHWLKWDQICKPRDRGGLGFFDLKLENWSLLNKWVWRFGTDHELLRKKIIAGKYGFDDKSILPPQSHCKKVSWVWRNISRPLADSEDPLIFYLRPAIGDGYSIDFWNDAWTKVQSLRLSFPRVFALAVKKEGKVSDFDVKGAEGWVWNIEIRRELFK